MPDTPSINHLLVVAEGGYRFDEPDAPAKSTSALAKCVEHCLASGVSPMAIMRAVGDALWRQLPAGKRYGDKTGEWPQSPMGGWSDEPRPKGRTA